MLESTSILRGRDSHGIFFHIAGAIFCFILCPLGNANPVVQLPNAGTVTGRFTSSSREFLGIPYAKSSRWTPPVDLKKLPSDPFEAKEFGPCCSQIKTRLHIPKMSEDCLNLNIFAPLTIPTGKNVPVMVFLHGGNTNTGCSAQSIPTIYNGTNMIAKAKSVGRSAIVVTLNYRLTIFATLFLDQIADKNPDAIHANYHIQDILSALRWIQLFISEFGGDPNRVTLFGQGSGANLVTLLPIVPLAKGLFHNIIAMSAQTNTISWVNRTQAHKKSLQASAVMGCNTTEEEMTSDELIDCLNDIEAEDVVNRIHTSTVGYTVDGVLVPNYPAWAIEKGEINPLSTVVMGWNTPDNFPLCRHVARANAELTMQWLTINVPLWTGATLDMVQRALEMYGIEDCKIGLNCKRKEESCCWLAEELLRDAVFRCNGWRTLNNFRTHNIGKQFVYNNECCPTCMIPGRRWRCVCANGAEIPYLFGTHSNYSSSSPPTCDWGETDHAFSAYLIDHFVSIAENSQPSDASSKWLPFEGKEMFYMNQRKPSKNKMVPWINSDRCEVWEEIEGAVSTSRAFGGNPDELWSNPIRKQYEKRKEDESGTKKKKCSGSKDTCASNPFGEEFVELLDSALEESEEKIGEVKGDSTFEELKEMRKTNESALDMAHNLLDDILDSTSEESTSEESTSEESTSEKSTP